MEERAKYWIELADYDFETAKAMFATGRYVYVGFMCHQTIEKSLKAVVAKTGDFPPKTHNLNKLSEDTNLLRKMSSEQQDFVAFLNPMNIDSRYPEYKKQLFEILTKEICKEVIKKNGGPFMLDKKEVIKLVKQYADIVAHELSPSAVILFGSYANGNANDDSDIDVAVIFDGFSGDWLNTSALLWRLCRKVSLDIEPILLDETQDQSGFVQHIYKTGEIIYKAA